jgi:uncharacterized membrane protein YbhN (UPF0104 family)
MGKKHLFTGIILVSLAGFFYLLLSFDLTKVLSTIASANLKDFTVFLFLSFFMIVGFTMIWREFLVSEGIDIGFGKLFNFHMVGFGVSYTTPGPRVGGEVIQANLAKSYGNFSVLVVTGVMEIVCIFISSVALVLLALLLTPILFPSVSLSILWEIMLALSVVIATIYIANRARTSLYVRTLNLLDYLGIIPKQHKENIDDFFADIKKFFTTKKHVLFRGLAIAAVCKLLLVTQVLFLLEMVGIQATLLQALLLAAAIEVAYAMPGYMGIGFLEAGQTGILALLGLPASIGVITAMMIRARDLIASGYGLVNIGFYSDPIEP